LCIQIYVAPVQPKFAEAVRTTQKAEHVCPKYHKHGLQDLRM